MSGKLVEAARTRVSLMDKFLEVPQVQGQLQVLGSSLSIAAKWTKMFLRLHDSILLVYDNDKSDLPRSVFLVEDCVLSRRVQVPTLVRKASHSKFTFSLKRASGLQLTLCAKDGPTMEGWIAALARTGSCDILEQ